MIDRAEIHWDLNSSCNNDCSYCQSQFRDNFSHRTTEEYLTVIEKLQTSRYLHHNSIHWRLGGGEPIQFAGISSILKKIKERPSTVTLETSGGTTWFDIQSVINYVDSIVLTYHSWQNASVVDFIIDACKERNKQLTLIIPLAAGKINECRQMIAEFVDQGVSCQEQILKNDNGSDWSGYSQRDLNIIYHRPEDWLPGPPPAIDPNYIDLSVVNNTDPVYTGKQCFAGVDWIYINHRGFPMYSQCRGRAPVGTVFDQAWEAPAYSFPCNMNQCKSQFDRDHIRIGS